MKKNGHGIIDVGQLFMGHTLVIKKILYLIHVVIAHVLMELLVKQVEIVMFVFVHHSIQDLIAKHVKPIKIN